MRHDPGRRHAEWRIARWFDDEIEAYLAEREELVEQVRQRIASHQRDLGDLRCRLLAQRGA